MKRNSMEGYDTRKQRSRSLEVDLNRTVVPPHQRSMTSKIPGQESISSSAVPLKAVRMPDETSSPANDKPPGGSILGEVHDEPQELPTSPEPLTANNMRVLVAEDDPVNSRIVKKRLEKLGHDVYLTVNGEECASAFGDKPRDFDVVLMDMQMPIVDGLTSTKMIRAFEKSSDHDGHSAIAVHNGGIPIFAVSASLIERERDKYIDAGFDGWILKPVDFKRLNTLLLGIVDDDVRAACLYAPGQWEQGGWFNLREKTTKVGVDQTAPVETSKVSPTDPSSKETTDCSMDAQS